MTSARPHRFWFASALVTAALVSACAGGADRALAPDAAARRPSLAAASLPSVRISEIHYNNAGTDVGEAVEVSFPAGMDLTGYRIVRFNGASSGAAAVYTTPAATNSEILKDLTPTVCTGGTRAVVVVRYPQDGIQNGPNDGLALVNGSTVIELLSYQGPFTVGSTQPFAPSMTSTDIGVSQTGSSTLDPIGASLQRSGSGTWSRTTANTFGACNDSDETPPAEVATVTVAPTTAAVTVGATTPLVATAKDANGQTVGGVTFTWETSAPAVATVNASGVVSGAGVGTATITAKAPNGVSGTATVNVSPAPGGASNVRVSEFHYDNDGTDQNERIELEGDVGGSLAGWSLVLYAGSTSSNPGPYKTIALSGTFSACTAGGARGVLAFDAADLQNGDKDGFALVNASGQVVEFLSYEGSFQAVNGPAAGMSATDVGVAESAATPTGRSLQRAGNGVWFGPYTSTFGACNAATPPPPLTGITFTGRLPGDAPLPVGFQDQLFASLKDANTGGTIATTITWTSETPAIATIDSRGVMTARAAGTAVLRATADDGTTATISLPTEVATFGNASLYRDPLAFGTPTDATPGDELRVTRSQYVLSYNKTNHNPNWVAYHLSKANRGDLPGYRCDCFTPDPLVVDADDPGVSTADYTNSGFDRGHMVRSNDREQAHGDQATTYYTTNIVPQWGNMNQGRWADLESYLQTVADGPGLPEVYIFTGPRGNAGTIANGKIVVPTHTWKVAVVLPAGMTPGSVTKKSDILDVIAVDMPNVQTSPRDGNWQASRTTVDAIEQVTGYDLLSALPNPLEDILESGDRAPTALLTGDGLAGGNEGQTLSFSAATSTDPDLNGPLADVLSFQWSVDGAVAGIGQTLDYTFTKDGTYSVRVIVSDRFGAADTASRMVTVLNVSPTVAALPPATILRGESYQASGSFTDPGADTWTAKVNYGDGSGDLALPLSGKSFQLAHTYAAAGSYTVTVTIFDGTASGTATATVVVLSPGDGVAELVKLVNALAAAGTLTQAEAGSLVAKLDPAIKQFAADRPSAVNQVQAFINEVAALLGSGRLSAADAAKLTAYAQRVIASAGA